MQNKYFVFQLYLDAGYLGGRFIQQPCTARPIKQVLPLLVRSGQHV